MSIVIENLPKTYGERVQWYASDWRDNTISVFDTKAQALACARDKWSGDPLHIVCVDWIPFGQEERDISRRSKITDNRRATIAKRASM